MLTDKQKVKAFDLFLKQAEQNIEDKIPDWLNENPYWDIDDEDANGNKKHRCPPTNTSDARTALCEIFISSGEDLGYGDFFEFIVYAIFGDQMSKNNTYRETAKEDPEIYNKDDTIDAALYLATALDNLFFPNGVNFPEIKKTKDGGKKNA